MEEKCIYGCTAVGVEPFHLKNDSCRSLVWGGTRGAINC